MTKPSKTEEKKWLSRIARYAEDYGCFPHGDHCYFDLHHVVGRSYVNNKIHIGSYFVIPVDKKYHDVHSSNPFNVTHFRKRYQLEFANQRDQFSAMVAVITYEDGELPIPKESYSEIMKTRY